MYRGVLVKTNWNDLHSSTHISKTFSWRQCLWDKYTYVTYMYNLYPPYFHTTYNFKNAFHPNVAQPLPAPNCAGSSPRHFWITRRMRTNFLAPWQLCHWVRIHFKTWFFEAVARVSVAAQRTERSSGYYFVEHLYSQIMYSMYVYGYKYIYIMNIIELEWCFCQVACSLINFKYM